MQPETPTQSPSSAQGTWIYGVVDRWRPPGGDAFRGIAGEPIRAVAAAGLVAVVGSVDLAEFGDDNFGDNSGLTDLDRVEGIARAHHSVLTALAALGPLVPFRLGTVYHHDGRVTGVLAQRRTELAAALRLVTGCTEWGVKGLLDPEAFAASLPRPDSPAHRTTGAGTAYLLRQKADLQSRDQLWRQASESAEALHEELDKFAALSRRYSVHDPDITAARPWTILNAAYLVANDRTAEFAAAVRQLERARPAVQLELTGPWPPYCVGVGSEVR